MELQSKNLLGKQFVQLSGEHETLSQEWNKIRLL